MVVIDHDGIIQSVNPACERLLDRTAAHLVGAHFGYPHAPDGEIDIELLTGGASRVATMRVAEIDWKGTPAFLASLRT
jgi:PAS domain-containing protein